VSKFTLRIGLPEEWISNTEAWKSRKILICDPQFVDSVLTE
jgi:hypothetical protein